MKQAGKKVEIYHTACYKFSEYLFQGNKVTQLPSRARMDKFTLEVFVKETAKCEGSDNIS